MNQQDEYEKELVEAVKKFVHNPLGFVYFVYPWGKKGTRLEEHDGPDVWQKDVLIALGKGLLTVTEAIQIAVSSGHGIGKTALIAWIIHWFISTRPNPQIVVTANTKPQLETKTWRELAVWHSLSKNSHWFEWSATKFRFIGSKTWFAAAIPWSKERSEAFAGTHEAHVLVIYDEASLIDDIIWEVTEGAMTTPGAVWIAFGNPTRNTGRFKECFGKFRHRWITFQIDSRTCRMANKKQIQQWAEDYGEDSDFFRVRVKGIFPKASVEQFIPEDVVDAAIKQNFGLNTSVYSWAPVLIGVDVARFGDDSSVIYIRQGLQTHKIMRFREIDTMGLAGHVANAIKEWKPQTVFVDVVGIGAGVVDRLRQLQFDNIVEVNAGAKANDEEEFYNKRAEMWSLMRDWLKAGGSIPDDQQLKDDLIGPYYGFDARSRLQLERKEDMKNRGLASPDLAEGLAHTFAMPVLLDEKKPKLSQAEEDWLAVTGQGGDNERAFSLEDPI